MEIWSGSPAASYSIVRTTPSAHWREWHLEIWLGSPAASYSIKRTTPSTHWREWHLEIWLGSPAASYSIKRITPSTHWREWHLEIWLGSPQPAIQSSAPLPPHTSIIDDVNSDFRFCTAFKFSLVRPFAAFVLRFVQPLARLYSLWLESVGLC